MKEIRQMNKTWNSYVLSDTPKIQLSIDEFIEKMNDDEFIENAIEKITSQNRISTCIYFKEENSFANIFLVKIDNVDTKKVEYYFIYKSMLSYSDEENFQFLPQIGQYKFKKLEIDSLDYLANFAIYINQNDYLYSVNEKRLMTYKEFLNRDI